MTREGHKEFSLLFKLKGRGYFVIVTFVFLSTASVPFSSCFSFSFRNFSNSFLINSEALVSTLFHHYLIFDYFLWDTCDFKYDYYGVRSKVASHGDFWRHSRILFLYPCQNKQALSCRRSKGPFYSNGMLLDFINFPSSCHLISM